MATSLTAFKRPFLALPFLLPSTCESVVTLQARRNQSSYRRTKQRLRVKPDASFGVSSTHFQDHIIHNPPSSAPSVYHTPTKFLPPDDVRRTLRGASVNHESSAELPSVFKTSVEKRYHLNPSDIEEIRKLRLNDPMTWSRWKLAKRFDCSPMFIAMVCEASPQKKEIQKQVLGAVQSRWGAKRRMAREDRQLRKESWGRDE
ncbi:mitochondrial ribosomal protein subunit L20-domain-containing protein [Aspergillus leporis]|uniref:Mitochondrial ribosomal protein subunit L20-domain-containing protein n=1 Tax=Aspergillus leporis TaxID=41062 RepID=A0A5N5X7G9_9EURO|nr:mitochondrial ribosomal protein subunit L20-domain-containing protein [Aspergillus leporis]